MSTQKSGFIRRTLLVLAAFGLFAHFLVLSGHFLRTPLTQKAVVLVLGGMSLWGIVTLLAHRVTDD